MWCIFCLLTRGRSVGVACTVDPGRPQDFPVVGLGLVLSRTARVLCTASAVSRPAALLRPSVGWGSPDSRGFHLGAPACLGGSLWGLPSPLGRPPLCLGQFMSSGFRGGVSGLEIQMTVSVFAAPWRRNIREESHGRWPWEGGWTQGWLRGEGEGRGGRRTWPFPVTRSHPGRVWG